MYVSALVDVVTNKYPSVRQVCNISFA